MTLQQIIQAEKSNATITSGNNTRYNSGGLREALEAHGLTVDVTDGDTIRDFDTFIVSNGTESVEFQF